MKRFRVVFAQCTNGRVSQGQGTVCEDQRRETGMVWAHDDKK